MTGSSATPAHGFLSFLRGTMPRPATRFLALLLSMLPALLMAAVLAAGPALAQEDPPPEEPEIPEHCIDDPEAFGCPDWDPCADVTGPWDTALSLSAPASAAWGDAISISASASTTHMCAPGASGGDITITVSGDAGNGNYSDTISGSSGSVTFAPFANAGSYTVTASYSGSGDISGSTATASLTVQKAITRTELTFSPDVDVITQGNPPTLTLQARVYREPDPNPPGGYPEGFVRFDLGGFSYADRVLPESGILEFSTGTNILPSGTFDITATYHPVEAPDMPWGGNDAPSTATKRLSIGVLGTSMTLTASPQTAGVGAPVTLTATLSPSNLNDPLEVSFYAGGVLLDTVQTSSRVATLTTTQIPAGIQTVRAEFAGTNNYSLSSAETTVVINGILTTTLVSANPTMVVPGGSSTLTAQIVPMDDGGMPVGGTVEFLEGDVVVASGPVTAGQGSAAISNLTEGTHYYRARYLGDDMYLGSTSDSTVAVSVGRLSTTTSITPSNQAVASGAQTTFSVQVAGLPGDPIPSGTVTFLDGTVELGTSDLANGVVTRSFGLADGLHSITAHYNGDADQAPSTSSAATAAVGTTASSINLQVIPAQPSIADEVSIRASVIGTGTPTGQARISGHGIGIPAQSLLAGQTTFDLGILPAGDYEFLVEYLGEGINDPSSASISFSISKRTSTTSIVATEGLLPPGSDLPVTILVAGGGFGTPTGEVTLTRNGTETLAVLPLSAGSATYTLTNLPEGLFSLEASYAGDETFAGSNAAIGRNVGLMSTQLLLSKAADPSPVGADNPVTATITHFDTSGAQPSGSVVFQFNGDFEQIVPLVDGVASADISGLPIGSYVVTASYAGDSRFAPDSEQTNLTISKSMASIVVSQSSSTSTFGDAVTFSATLTPVPPEVATPSGDVVFVIGPRNETATLVDGTASIVLDDLPAGMHSVVVTYDGDAVFAPVASSSIGHNVVKVASTATLSSSSNPSAPAEGFILTASVTSAAGIPSGMVSFQRGGEPIGTVALDGSGIATLPWTENATGTFGFVANYLGSDSHQSASSNVVNQIVGQASASLSLSVPDEPILAGSQVEVVATVSATPPATGTPEGNVLFSIDGGTPVSVPLVDGVATWTSPELEAGLRSFTASYTGFEDFSPASDTVVRTVTAIATTTTLSAAPNPSALGAAVELVAQVESASGAAQGTVSFYSNASLIDAIPVVDGVARMDWTPASIGTRTLTATYSGSSLHALSVSNEIAHVVNAIGDKGDVSLTLNAPASAQAGADLPISIEIAPIAPATEIPTGTYDILVDGITEQSVAVTGPVVEVTLTGLASGTRNIVARYSGDVAFNGRDSNQAVVQIATATADIVTTTSVSVAPNPLSLGSTATITAIVVPESGTVSSGTVAFYVDGALLGTAQPSSGEATFAYSPASVGNKSIAASYSGDSIFLPSTSLLTTLIVEETGPAKVATSVVATPTSITAIEGETASIQIDVVPDGGGTPTGIIAIQFDGGPVSTLSLVDGSASWTSPSLVAGNHGIQIAYLGDDDFLASAGQVPVVVTGPQGEISTSTSLLLSSTSIVVGEQIIFTANVLPSSGTPVSIGAVEFFVDGSSIGSADVINGTASLTHVPDTVGTFQAIAVYGGATGAYLGSTSVQASFSATEGGVELEPTTITLSSLSTEYEIGQAATVSILVSASQSAGTPTGSVDVLFDGEAPIAVALVDGTATWTTPALTAGSHTILVIYEGDAAFSGSASLPFVLEATDPVVESITTTQVFAEPYPGIAGQTSTLSATVVAQSGDLVSSGEVDLHVDGASIGLATVVNGAASIAWVPPTAATYDVQAFYSGSSGSFLASSSQLSAYVVEDAVAPKTATTTTATPDATAVTAGQTVDIEIVVSAQPPSTGTPTGSVNVVIDGQPAVEVALVDGAASWTTPALDAGSHSITVNYTGDDDFSASVASTIVITVTAPAEASATTTIAMATPFPGIVGQETTFTASITAQNGATVEGGLAEFRRDGVPFASVPVVNGMAATAWTPDAAGNHTIEIAYSGVPDQFLASVSEIGAYPVEEPAVTRTPTTTTVSSWDIVTVPTQSIEVDVVVAAVPPAVSVPSGTISVVLDGGTPESVVLIDGRATWSTALLPVGTHTIVISYSGDDDHEPSISEPLVIEVAETAAGTTTTVGATPFPGIVGQETVFTASVSTDAGVVEGGTVVFGRGGVPFATVPVVNGQATTAWTPDVAGSYVITADYSGVEGVFLPSSATPGAYPVEEAVVVEKARSALVATPSSTTVQAGSSATISISVLALDGSAETPSGSVLVSFDGAGAISVPLSNGMATWATPPLAEGVHSIALVYEGDANFLGSTAPSIVIEATADGAVSTSASLFVAPQTGLVGQPSTLTAMISATNAATVSTGAVQFFVDGALVDTVSVQNGSAVTTWSPSAARSHDIVAIYGGATGQFGASTSQTLVYVVGLADPDKHATTISATPDRTSVVAGETVDIEIVVTPTGATGTIPSGNVLVSIDGGEDLVVALSNGMASWTSPALSAGGHVVTIAYSGDDEHLPSSTGGLTILAAESPQAAQTFTSLSVSPTNGEVGSASTLVAQVSSSGIPVLSGTVRFIANGTQIGAAAVVDGFVDFDWIPAAAGTYAIEARYAGVAGAYLPSNSSIVVHQVLPIGGGLIPTSIALDVPASPVPPSQILPISAEVSTASGVLSGTVEFTANGAPIGSTGIGANGLASISWTTPAAAGNVTIGARYLGSATHEQSSTTASLQVSSDPGGLRPTSVSLTISPNPAVEGSRASIRVDVSQIAPDVIVPTGTATITIEGLGSFQGQLINGSIIFQTPILPLGSHIVSAVYGGDAVYASNASGTTTLVVETSTGKDASTTTIVADPVEIDLGDTTNLTATVIGSGTGTPSGTVEFRRGAQVLGSVALVNGEASFDWTPAAVGQHSISAHYLGDLQHDPSSSVPTSIVVLNDDGTLAESQLSLAVHPAIPYAGQTAVIVATVLPMPPAVGTPTGQVSFTMNGVTTTVPLVDGQASFATPPLVAGPVSITASYGGDAVFSESSGTISFVALAPGMQPTTSVLTSSAAPAAIGQTVVYDLRVTAPNGTTPNGEAILVIDGVDQETIQLTNGRATWTRQFSTSGNYQVGALYTGTSGYGPSASNVILQQITEEMVPGSITIRQIAGRRDAVFAFSSDAPGLSGSISTAHGRGQIGPVEVQPGTYTILGRDPADVGYVISMISCTDDDGSVDVLARKAVVNLAPGENVVCTFSSIDASLETVELIEDFLDARADILISNLPGIDRRIDRLQDEIAMQTFSPGQMLMSYSSVFDGAPMRFSSSLSAIDGAVGNRQPNQFDVWIEGAVGTVQRGGAGDGLYGIVSVGADYRVSDGMLVGVMGQYDRMNLDQSTGASVAGDGWLVGPYMTMRLGNGVYLDLMGAVGASRNDISPYGTYTDEFHTRRYLLNATLQGDWDMGDWTFSPRARATYFDETSDSYMDSRGIRIPEVSTRKGSLSIGPGASYAFSLDAIELEVGARAEVAADISGANGSVGVQNARGRLEGMLDIGLPGGANLDLTLVYDGIGSSNTSIGARAGLLVPLN